MRKHLFVVSWCSKKIAYTRSKRVKNKTHTFFYYTFETEMLVNFIG